MRVVDKVGSIRFEKRSLRAGMVANLFMGTAGVIASLASNSEALMVDGLYSGVNFIAALVAAKVSHQVQKLPDRSRPFGYDAHEAVYVLFRSLVLIGIIVFALVSGGGKIVHYLQGGSLPELIFGPILIYSVGMVVICLSLAGWHHHNLKASGGRSEILKTERTAALVDGMLSAGTGLVLMLVPYLKGTSLDGLIPVSDAVVVLVLGTVMLGGPVKMLRGALGEVVGASAPDDVVEDSKKRVEELLAPLGAKLRSLVVTKMGRRYFVVAYIEPDGPIEPEDFDLFRKSLYDCLLDELGVVSAEAVFTRKGDLGGASIQEG